MAIGLFFPLGWLTQYQATNLWFIGSIATLLIIMWLAGGVKRPPLELFAVSVMAVFLFPPVLSHLMLGQFTVIATLMLLLAAQTSRYLLAGFFLAVSLAKPQLTILVIPGLLLAHGRDNGLKAVMSLVGALILWIILLTIPLWVAYPPWFDDFIAALRQNVDWAHPSLFTLLQVQWGIWGLFLWGLLAVGVFGANLWLWFNRPSEEAVVWSLALTPLINPYIWSWDFTMLVPLMIYAAFRLRSRMARVLLGFGYVLCWSLIVWIRFNTDKSDHRFWWVPWLIVACVCSAYIVSARPLHHRKMLEENQ